MPTTTVDTTSGSKSRVRKTTQLVARVTPEQKELVEQAAALLGRSVTDFMTEALQEKATAVLRDEADLVVWRLSRADAIAFADALAAPREPSEAMRASYAKYLAMKEQSTPGAG
jgi:uncharacterized protein (DUF1778 family)